MKQKLLCNRLASSSALKFGDLLINEQRLWILLMCARMTAGPDPLVPRISKTASCIVCATQLKMKENLYNKKKKKKFKLSEPPSIVFPIIIMVNYLIPTVGS